MQPISKRWWKQVAIMQSGLLTSFGCYGCVQGQDSKPFSRTMNINPKSLKVMLSNPVDWAEKKDSGPFFWPFYGASGDYSVNHYDGKTPYPHRVRYNSFYVSSGNVLLYRSKDQELARGPFGVIYAETHFDYREDYGPRVIRFNVQADSDEIEHERPTVVSARPQHILPRLTMISLVRVFRSAKGDMVAVGSYSPEGRLLAPARAQLMKNGERVHIGGSDVYDAMATKVAPGFPKRVDVMKYLQSPKPFWKSISMPNTTSIVSLHYSRNKYVRQETFVGKGSPKTRHLTYVATPQDVLLAPLDQKMQFKASGQM